MTQEQRFIRVVQNSEWFNDHRSLHELATWLLETDPMFTVLDVMDLLESPWEWEDKWRAFNAESNSVLWAMS